MDLLQFFKNVMFRHTFFSEVNLLPLVANRELRRSEIIHPERKATVKRDMREFMREVGNLTPFLWTRSAKDLQTQDQIMDNCNAESRRVLKTIGRLYRQTRRQGTIASQAELYSYCDQLAKNILHRQKGVMTLLCYGSVSNSY